MALLAECLLALKSRIFFLVTDICHLSFKSHRLFCPVGRGKWPIFNQAGVEGAQYLLVFLSVPAAISDSLKGHGTCMGK